ncbi:DeoR/GlpR family DNA-binding transcription regulator [Derxia gummosa]|uniref:DeoR/GlpR family DNA-binding transcription regulator n=1 Tax=Derxia gummosa DSM 723 TaxID=1121388 RepID=A0A8B6X7Y1_9BURK|nr:DeoR/GlpR family DNA-binding transcription regulator [Derxia gummosa]
MPDARPELNARQQDLIERVRREGFASVDELARAFDVTPQTVRRDINQLAELGLLRRQHGGASLPTGSQNLAYDDRRELLADEKRRIARAAARHIPDNASLFINLGTTTEEVARALSGHRGLRVITNNLNVATLMAGYEECEVIVAGGVVRARDLGVIGGLAIDFIRQFKVDFAVIGTSSIEADGTLRDFDARETRVAEAIIEGARAVFLVADHSKFDRPALVRGGHLSQVNILFTDAAPPESWSGMLARAGTQVVVAD